MAHVPPFHTNASTYPPARRAVYHDYNDCHDGKVIEPGDRVKGTGGKPRCKECTNLASSV